jgi:hypothetical protein
MKKKIVTKKSGKKASLALRKSFITDIKTIIAKAREQAIRSVDHHRILMYWHVGKTIFEEEQQGKDRADYGTYLLSSLEKELTPEFGSGFSYRQLAFYRQFYRTFPIVNAVRS